MRACLLCGVRPATSTVVVIVGQDYRVVLLPTCEDCRSAARVTLLCPLRGVVSPTHIATWLDAVTRYEQEQRTPSHDQQTDSEEGSPAQEGSRYSAVYRQRRGG